MDNEERLRRRIVLALDALPVPPERRTSRAPRPVTGATDLLPGRIFREWLPVAVALAAIAFVAVMPNIAPSRPESAPATPTSVQPSRLESAAATPTTVTPGPQPAPAMQTMSEDFSLSPDASRWFMFHGEGGAVIGGGGTVQLVILGAITGDAGPETSVGMALTSCMARGDYEVSLDYELLEWPFASGTQLELAKAGVTTTVTTDGAVTDHRGSLRLVGHIEGPSPDQTFRIRLTTRTNALGDRTVRVAIDNFRLSAEQIVCR